MAAQHQQWITVESTINDYISQAALSPNSYNRLYHIAYRGMEDLGMDFFYQVKSVMLPVEANKTVKLPEDFLFYNKFGVLNGSGQLVPLQYNDSLTKLKDLSPTRTADISAGNFPDYYSYSSPVFFNYWDGSGFSNFYGVAGNGLYGGGFKIDNDNGVIILGPGFGYTGLVLEYTASPDVDQEYRIPVQFREALIAWIAWKDIANIINPRKANLGDKRDRRHEYFEARRLGMAKYRPFSLDQAYQQSLDNQRLVVKA